MRIILYISGRIKVTEIESAEYVNHIYGTYGDAGLLLKSRSGEKYGIILSKQLSIQITHELFEAGKFDFTDYIVRRIFGKGKNLNS